MDLYSRNYWLFLRKSRSQQSHQSSLEDYEYISGKKYTYDNYVANHKNIRLDDIVIFRENELITGYANIHEIKSFTATKTMRRCPRCESTAIRERKTVDPKWICANPRFKECKYEFNEPFITNDQVEKFEAHFLNFKPFNKRIAVNYIKSCSATKYGVKSQVALMRLDPYKLIHKVREIFD